MLIAEFREGSPSRRSYEIWFMLIADRVHTPRRFTRDVVHVKADGRDPRRSYGDGFMLISREGSPPKRSYEGCATILFSKIQKCFLKLERY